MTTAIVKAEPRKERALVIQEALESRAAQLMEVMPDGLDGSRFIRATLTAISRNPDLLACTPESIITAVYDAAEIGLVPTGALNRAWLIPQRHNVGSKDQPRYVTEAELRIGYQGLADLARNSGEVTSIECRPVYDKDTFEVAYGTDPKIVHLPDFDANMTPAGMTHVYAVAVLRDGSRVFEVMTKAQIDGIRARAPGANRGPWATDYIQMARKTVFRRLCNYLPLTPMAQAALAKDDQREFSPKAVLESGGRTNEVKALLGKRAGAPEPAVEAPGDEIEGEAADVTPPAPAPATSGLCGAPDTSAMEMGHCHKPKDHAGTHGNENGTWPR